MTGSADELSGATCLMTGGEGFVGQALLPRLEARGLRCRVLRRTAAGSRSAGTATEYRFGDLGDARSLRQACEQAGVVFHLAGYAHAGNGEATFRHRHREINYDGTINVFLAACAAGVRRFVYVSSVKAAGHHPTRCLDETDALPLSDPYSESKRAAEAFLLEQARKGDMHIAIIRPSLVYGPGVKGNLAAMLAAIDRGRLPPVPETGNHRSMVDVRDLCEAIIAAAERPEAHGRTYIITDGEAYSTRRIYEAMARALGRDVPSWAVPAWALRALGRAGDVAERILHRSLPYNGAVASRLLDSACYRSVRAEADLGLRPRYRLEDALPEMVAAYRG